MLYSIQEYLKRINSRITKLDSFSIFITMVLLIELFVYLHTTQIGRSLPVTYSHPSPDQEKSLAADPRPFASVNGSTYTFVWCQGANMITVKNRVYFKDQAEAQKSGRSLSKLCNK